MKCFRVHWFLSDLRVTWPQNWPLWINSALYALRPSLFTGQLSSRAPVVPLCWSYSDRQQSALRPAQSMPLSEPFCPLCSWWNIAAVSVVDFMVLCTQCLALLFLLAARRRGVLMGTRSFQRAAGCYLGAALHRVLFQEQIGQTLNK